jgi:hypothetical protein
MQESPNILKYIQENQNLLGSLVPGRSVLFSPPDLPLALFNSNYVESHIAIPISESLMHTFNNKTLLINKSAIETKAGFSSFRKATILNDYDWNGITIYEINSSLISAKDYSIDPLPRYF